MTGVEAVSNGVSAFAAPPVKNAQRTLTAIVVILGSLLAGIAYLSHAYGIGAMDQENPQYQSIISQLVSAVVGKGLLYYITIGSVLMVLALSANTSFAGFPRLCRLIANDDFMPHSFALRGRRLVYSTGIFILTVLSAVLLIAFGGITDRLIPLFAVETLEPEIVERLPGFERRMQWFMDNHADVPEHIETTQRSARGVRRLLSLVNRKQLRQVLNRMLDETEFLSPYGVRALSRYHMEHPYEVQVNGHNSQVEYEPAESQTGLFGGNSNWRGPIWFPVNYLLIEALQKYIDLKGPACASATGSGLRPPPGTRMRQGASMSLSRHARNTGFSPCRSQPVVPFR